MDKAYKLIRNIQYSDYEGHNYYKKTITIGYFKTIESAEKEINRLIVHIEYDLPDFYFVLDRISKRQRLKLAKQNKTMILIGTENKFEKFPLFEIKEIELK